MRPRDGLGCVVEGRGLGQSLDRDPPEHCRINRGVAVRLDRQGGEPHSGGTASECHAVGHGPVGVMDDRAKDLIDSYAVAGHWVDAIDGATGIRDPTATAETPPSSSTCRDDLGALVDALTCYAKRSYERDLRRAYGDRPPGSTQR